MDCKTVTTVRLNQAEISQAIEEWVALHSIGEASIKAENVVFLDNNSEPIQYGMVVEATD